MSELLRYFSNQYGVLRPGDITWAHAVNSQAKLEKYLSDQSTMFIETDIRRSAQGLPVAAHPPATESDLSFEILIDQLVHAKQGLKLDFKDPEIVTVCLERLKRTPLHQPIMFNADILQGNGAEPSRFSAGEFIAQCRTYYPAGILSLGWTTIGDPELGFTAQHVAKALSLCPGIDEVTFPVRACLLPKSWNALVRLLEKNGYTLTIWNGEPLSEELHQWIKANTNPDKTFYDLIDQHKEPLSWG